MTKTENYQLNQWDATDRVLREDFNADNRKIEEALNIITAQALQLYVGSYIGNGQSTRTIDLGTFPQAVYLCERSGQILGSGRYYGGLALPEHPVWLETPNLPVLELCPSGFIVHYLYSDPYKSYAYSNANEIEYHYIALC